MKKIFVTLVMLIIASESQAVIADRFRCSLFLQDGKLDIYSSVQKVFSIIRLPVAKTTDPSIKYTAGAFEETLYLNKPESILRADLHINYKHAIKLDSSGKPMEARQSTCINISGCTVEQVPFPGGSSCVSGNSCIENDTPFDPVQGWDRVAMFGDIPAFANNNYIQTSSILDDKGTTAGVITMKCQFLGTYQ